MRRSKRLDLIPPYLFVKIEEKKEELVKNGVDVIDFGIGDPDLPTPEHIIAKMREVLDTKEAANYPTSKGEFVFRKAVSKWYQKRFKVELNPRDEICCLIGSKEGLAHLPLAFIDPGDVTLVPDPSYPVYKICTTLAGGEPYLLPLTAENKFIPDLDKIPADVLKKAKILFINYPNNPTGASATPEFFARVVEFAKKHRLVVISDAAYAALVYEGKPLSFLATPGAKDVGVELHSVSKSFNMTGWRCGFVAGNELLVRAYGDVKDNTDSGQFLAIQHAAAYCLDHPEITQQIAAKYSRRMDLLVAALRQAGFAAHKPKGSFFLYVPAPKAAVKKTGERIVFQTAEDASQWLITEKLISTVPWDDVGAYLRLSVTFAAKDAADEQRIMGELGSRLGDVRFEF